MDIQEKLGAWITETLSLETAVHLEHPSDLVHGDFSSNIAMRSKTPKETALEYVEKLNSNLLEEVEKVEVAGMGFINIYLSPQFFSNSLKEILEQKENYGKSNILKGEKIFFEHTQPNPFKQFHIGHLMNNAIGESLARLLKEAGAELKVATYHGDVGLQIAKTIWGVEKLGGELSVEFFGQAYAAGAQAYEEGEVKQEIIEINKKIYDRSDEKINKLYDAGRKISLEYFDFLYEKLDSHFDFHFYESESGEVGKKLVLENIGQVFEESEGAVVFKGENFEPKTHTRVFLSKEKLPTYEAKELGLAKIKKDAWKYDRSMSVVANEQDSFFKVVEVVIGEIFPELKGKLKHVSHGLLKLPTGKMSSRTGDVITAEALLDEVKMKILEKIIDRDFTEEEKNTIAEIVSLGAIKYTILRQSVGGDIIFDFEKSISFEGDSGPYLQYAYIRAKSVLEKSEPQNFEGAIPVDWQPRDIEKILYRFPEVIERSVHDYSPHHMVTYLTELAGSFNSFYANEKIIEDSDSSLYKLALTEAVSLVLKNGLHLLGIKVPERM